MFEKFLLFQGHSNLSIKKKLKVIGGKLSQIIFIVDLETKNRIIFFICIKVIAYIYNDP